MPPARRASPTPCGRICNRCCCREPSPPPWGSRRCRLPRPRPSRLELAHWPDLDAAFAGRRDLRRRLDRLVEVPRLDQIEAGKLLFRFGERPVGHRYPAVADPQRCGGGDRLQRLRRDEDAALAQAVAACLTLPVGDGPKLLFL